MKRVKLSVAVAFVLAALPLVSFAQDAEVAEEEEESPISWELTAVSDYVFRGVSQTDENPTAQASITYTAPFGAYAGVWASGVDFGGSKPDFEVDYYVGYGFEISDAVALDVMLNRYTYPDAGELNYNELITNTTFADTYTVTVAYTDDFFAGGQDSWYFALGTSFDLTNDYSLDLSVGHTTIEDSLYDDYSDYSVGFSKSWGPVTASLAWIGTDSHGEVNFGELAEDRAVLTLSVGQ